MAGPLPLLLPAEAAGIGAECTRGLAWCGGATTSTPDPKLLFLPRPSNYPPLYPKYPLLRAIRALLKGTWGVLVDPHATRIPIQVVISSGKTEHAEFQTALETPHEVAAHALAEQVVWNAKFVLAHPRIPRRPVIQATNCDILFLQPYATCRMLCGQPSN